MDLTPDFDQAEHYLSLLDEEADSFCFRTFDDNKKRKSAALVSVFYGSFDQCNKRLAALNNLGAGVFVTVNETDGQGQKKQNIKRIRTVFQEDDDALGIELPVEPHLVVETSPGKHHRYMFTSSKEFEAFDGVQQCLVDKYGSDRNAKDLARVLRLPGFYHVKDISNPVLVNIVSESGAQPYSWEEIKKAFPSQNANKPCNNITGFKLSDPEVKRIRQALVYIPSDNRDQWLKVGMALNAVHSGDQTFGLWGEWSAQSEKFNFADQRKTWDSFSDRAGGLTIASLYETAKHHGWVPLIDRPPSLPIEFYSDDFPVGSFDNSKNVHSDNLKNGLFSFSEIMARLSGADYLIKPFLCTNSVGTLFGDSGTMKSFVAIDFGMCVATGKDYHGFNTNQGPVVYVCGEGGGGVPKRLKAWCMEHGVAGTEIPFFVTKLPVALMNQMEVATIADDIQKACKAPALIIIDTLSANFGDGDESSNSDMSKLLTNVSIYFKEMGACVLFVHHVGHGDRGRERGAYSLRANVDFRIQVERLTEISPISLSSLKVKDGAIFKPISFKPKVIAIPALFDSEGEQETSVVLGLCDYQGDLPVVTGCNQKIALDVLEGECKARRKELQHRGSNKLPWVPFGKWYDLFLKKYSVRRDSFKRSVKGLVDEKVVIKMGDMYRVVE